MLWYMHFGSAARITRSSRARYQPRLEALENRLTPTTDLLPPMVGGEALVVPDLTAPPAPPVIAAEVPSDSAEAPSDQGMVGAEEPPIIVGGDGTLPVIDDSQASATPPEAQDNVPVLPPAEPNDAPTSPPEAQFELPPFPPTDQTIPPNIVNWGADEVVPIQAPPALPTPAVSIGEPASGFGEVAPVASNDSGVTSEADTNTAPVASSALNAWVSPATASTPLLAITYTSAVDQVFSTPTPQIAPTTKSTEAHADLFGVGADVKKEPAETDLLALPTQLAKADAEQEEEDVHTEQARVDAEAAPPVEATTVQYEESVVA